jgi:hypothetical protein
MTRTWTESRVDKKILVVVNIDKLRIPLYCKVDKLTNLTLHIRLSLLPELSTGGTLFRSLSQQG